MKFVDINKRTRDSEVMDDFELQGEELNQTLRDLDKVNRWLGGNKITIKGIKQILAQTNSREPIKVVDVGCGNGTMLRQIADYGRKKAIEFQLTGIDANPHAIEIAREMAKDYAEISFEAVNIFSREFAEKKYDIVLCTLTLHHFEDEQIRSLLKQFTGMANLGVVINDLQRSRLAYYLFQAFCAVFIRNDIARDDGLTSIRRGFLKKDLQNFAGDISVQQQRIRWKWAFRYQWIIIKSSSTTS